MFSNLVRDSSIILIRQFSYTESGKIQLEDFELKKLFQLIYIQDEQLPFASEIRLVYRKRDLLSQGETRLNVL